MGPIGAVITACNSYIYNSRRAGRPKRTWQDTLKEDLDTGCWCEWRERYCQRPCQLSDQNGRN